MFFKKVLLLCGALLMASVLITAGCGGEQKAPQQEAKKEKGIAKFGVVTPLSGGAAVYGTHFKRGIDEAVQEINSAGGITVGGKQYELQAIYQDDQGKSDVAATVGKRLASQDRVPLIMMPASWSAFPMMAFNQQPGAEFIIMATSQTPAFTKQGNKLVVRIVNNVERTMKDWVGRVFAYYDSAKIKYDKFAVMQVNTELGAAWSTQFQKEVKARGKEIVGVEEYDANKTDFYSQITNIIAKKPDIIVLTTVSEPSAIVINQATELGFKGKFLNSAAATPEATIKAVDPKLCENMTFESSTFALGFPEVEAFKSKMRQKYNEEPQFITANGYDGVRITAKAMEISGSISDPNAIRKAMGKAFESTKPMLTGMRDFDETGDVLYPMYPAVIEGGKVRGIKD